MLSQRLLAEWNQALRHAWASSFFASTSKNRVSGEVGAAPPL
jgi:hypothetical protein